MKLIDLIKQAVEELPEGDPRELASYVAQVAPSRELRQLLAEAASDACREYLRYQRNSALDNANNPRPKPKPSKKLAEYRAWWTDLLKSSVEVNSKWKLLGDCTVHDLQYCIDQRNQEIAKLESRNKDYRKLIDLIHFSGVDKVSEIPYETAAQEFGQVA